MANGILRQNFPHPQVLYCFLAATGARVSELVQIKVEHVKVGYIDLYTKGGKIRRLFIPKTLREEALKWIKCLKN